MTLSVDFRSELGADGVEAAITRMERGIGTRDPEIRRVSIEAQSRRAHRRDRTRSRRTAGDGGDRD